MAFLCVEAAAQLGAGHTLGTFSKQFSPHGTTR